MPKVYPFRGLRYNPAKVPDLTKVTTQPYDRIGPELQDEYYRRHPHNIVRIIRTKEESDPAGKYATSARTLEEWIRDGILMQESKPCLYVYYQISKTPEGEKTRKGFTAMVRLEEPGKGRVHPHEETHSGPKVDRFQLLSATRAHTEQVFLLYSDPEKRVNRILDSIAARPPDLEAKDDLGETHRVWRVMDPATIAQIQKDLESRDAIIADGHHRYETAWNFRAEMLKQGKKCEGTETFENVLATAVNMDDEGMTIFGTHRLCYDVPNFEPARLVEAAGRFFDVRPYPFDTDAEEASARRELLEDLRIEGMEKPCFGVAAKGAKEYFLFVVRDVKAAAARVKVGKSEDWRSLDVNLLHSVILEPLLGIGPEQLKAERNVEYVRDVHEAIGKARGEGKHQVAFLVNPVKLSQIRKIVAKGERFPQKTTDFYPKLLTGLLLCKLNFT